MLLLRGFSPLLFLNDFLGEGRIPPAETYILSVSQLYVALFYLFVPVALLTIAPFLSYSSYTCDSLPSNHTSFLLPHYVDSIPAVSPPHLYVSLFICLSLSSY